MLRSPCWFNKTTSTRRDDRDWYGLLSTNQESIRLERNSTPSALYSDPNTKLPFKKI